MVQKIKAILSFKFLKSDEKKKKNIALTELEGWILKSSQWLQDNWEKKGTVHLKLFFLNKTWNKKIVKRILKNWVETILKLVKKIALWSFEGMRVKYEMKKGKF